MRGKFLAFYFKKTDTKGPSICEASNRSCLLTTAFFLAFSSEKKLTEIERFVCEDGVSRFTLLIGAFRELSAELGRRVKRIIQTGNQQEQSIKYKESRNSWQKPQKLILVPPTGAKWPLFQKLEI